MGCWNANFTSQAGTSTIDGQDARRGIVINSGVTVALHNFNMQHAYTNVDGGGVLNQGKLTLYSSQVKNNTARNAGGIASIGALTLIDTLISHNRGGIWSYADITLIRSSVLDNGQGNGDGIQIHDGALTLDNSTIAGNPIYHSGITWVNNSTVTNFERNPLQAFDYGISFMQNSIIANNVPLTDCRIQSYISFGFNLIGNAAQCNYPLVKGDQIGVSPRLVGFGNGVAILPGSLSY